MKKEHASHPTPGGKRLLLKAAGLIGLCGWLMAPNDGRCGDAPALTEYQVKALFLLNFAKYVEWPASSLAETNSPFAIGVYGENKFGDDLQKVVVGKNIGGRGIVVRPVESAGDAGKCSILFISASEKGRLAGILDQVKDLPVLTVGESEDFIEQGGAIKFTKKEGKVRLEINLQAARQAHLQISSKLLKVADTVKGKSN